MVLKEKRVLFVAPTAPPTGGVSFIARELLRLKQFKSRVIHLDTSDRRSIGSQGRIDLVNIAQGICHPLKALFFILCFPRIKAVYLFLPDGRLGFLKFAFFLIVARLCNKPIIAHYERRYYFDKMYRSLSGLGQRITKALIKKIDYLIILWPDIFQTDFKDLIEKEKVRIVPNAVKTSRYRPSPGTISRRFKKKEIQLIFLGTLVKRKGVDELFRAFGRLKKEHPNIYLDILGDQKTVESQTVERYLSSPPPGIKFHGITTGRKKILMLQGSDIFVLPSHVEGLSLALLEAMAAGLPVVTTNRGSAQYFIKDYQHGFIVPAKNETALKEALARLIKSRELRKKMAKNNLKLVKRFDIIQTAGKIIRVFNEID